MSWVYVGLHLKDGTTRPEGLVCREDDIDVVGSRDGIGDGPEVPLEVVCGGRYGWIWRRGSVLEGDVGGP